MNKLPDIIEVPVPTQTRSLKLVGLKFAVVSLHEAETVYALFGSKDSAKKYRRIIIAKTEVINIETGEVISPTSKSTST